MRWTGESESRNVEDRRGMRPGMVGGGIGTVVVALIAMFLGVDPRVVLQNQPAQTAPTQRTGPAPNDSMSVFVKRVLSNTEGVWHRVLPEQAGQQYQEPRLVIFDGGATQTACGMGQTAMGPFYCPPDRSVYIDLSFYRDLKEQLGAPGDFAQAYVIAHEVGHHVQNLLGISEQVHQAEQRADKVEANALSVRLELQADCFAGVWGNHAPETGKVQLESGDVEEALNAATSIGDDRLQQQSQGRIVPESFTHGSSAQRVRWFRRGFESGDMKSCDTFNASTP